VLDINNNLRDITEQLKRYDLLGDRINTENIKNKIDIFNSGYFISNIKNLNWDNVNKERNKRTFFHIICYYMYLMLFYFFLY